MVSISKVLKAIILTNNYLYYKLYSINNSKNKIIDVTLKVIQFYFKITIINNN